MHPHLFSIFDTAVSGYLALIATGFAFGTAIGVLWVRRIGQNPDVVVDMGLSAIVFGLIGARLLHVVADGYFWDYVHLCTDPSQVHWQVTKAHCLGALEGLWDAEQQFCRPRQRDCWAWAQVWGGGLTFFGGFAAAFVACYRLARRDHFPVWKGMDMTAMVLPVGLGLGRLGCFLAGCCFGHPSSVPWALQFPPYSPASEWQFRHGLLDSPLSVSLAVHPTQIYESLAALGIAAYCSLVVQRSKRYDGQVFVWFLVLYGAVRFAVEGLRSDDRGAFLGFSTSQWISTGLLAAAAAIHFGRSTRKDRRVRAANIG